MTLVITAAAAVIATMLRFLMPAAAAKYRLGTLALIYGGAALMWVVDGFACLAEGEPFIELTDPAAMADDALLGASVIVLGLIAWGIVLAVKKAHGRKRASATA